MLFICVGLNCQRNIIKTHSVIWALHFQRIAIKFLTFNIGVGESKSFCDGNAVRVHDGVRWLSFCGAAPLETSYTCQGGVLRVQYVSDGTRQASTPVFSIKYFSPPGKY